MDGFTAFYQACGHPLFYNGDIETLENIRNITLQFPLLKGVMLGRGLLAHPWIAAEYESEKELPVAVKREKLETFHALLLEEYQLRLEGGEHQVLAKIKTLWDYLVPEADKKLRKKVLKSNSVAAYNQAVCQLFGAYPFI